MRIISGKYGRRRFDVPSNITARPTTDFARENIFNVLENIIDFEGLSALDLFAGTGAISFELASRGVHDVTSVEMAPVQFSFINKVKGLLKDDTIQPVRADVFKFVARCSKKFDFIFADPPYNLPNFAEVPKMVLNSGMLKEDSIFIIEHSKNYDFSDLPNFWQKRTYGSVNFSLFRFGNSEE